jgi:hypothetical protein
MAHSFIIETRKKEKKEKVVAWKRVARPNYREREPGQRGETYTNRRNRSACILKSDSL